MKNVTEVDICGHRLVVKSEEDEQNIRAVERYLNNKIQEVKERTKAVSTLDLTILAALNITGELMSAEKRLGELEKKSEELLRLIQKEAVNL